jgi:HisJ family histidinol phosphate phosphatase
MKPTHDLHVHTALSQCADKDTATVENYITAAQENGIKVLGFANHMWDSKVEGANDWYIPQNFEHISKIRSNIPINLDSPEILIGCETEFDANSVLGISEETMRQLDFVLAPHTHTHFENVMPKKLRFDFKKHADYLYGSFLRLADHPLAKYITAIAHPFAPVGMADYYDEILAFLPDKQLEECFKAAKAVGMAIEINTSAFSRIGAADLPRCQFVRMIKVAKAVGCKFTIGTDSHRPEAYSYLHYADSVTDLAGITDEDILKVFKRI